MIYLALTPLIGALITTMNQVNSKLTAAVGSALALVLIHAVGLAASTAAIALRREKRNPARLLWYRYAGGAIGIGTVLASAAAFRGLGASMATALALLGQMAGAVALDATGLLGRRKHPLEPGQVPGLAASLLGIAVMAGPRIPALFPATMALLAGILPLSTFTLNSQLALEIGVFRSSRMNFLTGLCGSVAIALAAFATSALPSLDAIGPALAAHPFMAIGGGVMGVIMVGSVNVVFPRIPAIYATTLLFAGQALIGLAIDAIDDGAIPVRKLAGVLILLGGMLYNAVRESRKPASRIASR